MKAGIGSARDEMLKLGCPFCAAGVEVMRAQLVDGRAVQCPRCKREATLTKGHPIRGGPEQWRLIEVEFDDERR